MIIYALLTVTVVVLFITFNVRVTIFVVGVVILVLVYMVGICQYWDVQMSHIFAVNLCFGLGIAIDYSVHIAHKYLTVVPPQSLKTDQEIRDYKVAKAVSQMGSSVFHGGFSTLLAVSVLFFA